MSDVYKLKQEELILLQKKKELQAQLPHLYGFPWYKWARRFFDSKHKLTFICAANQISKSSTQIRKFIHWATEPSLWPELWKTPPQQFWYLYPSFETYLIEFQKKWVPEFMPRGDMKDDPQYGWREVKIKNKFAGVEFNTGVTLFFKTYTQDIQHLQTGTVHFIGCDEELPTFLFDELMFRLAATNGYFSMVFTATLGQEFWYNAMERVGTQYEVLPEAFKQQISMYDCLRYEDGSATPWTKERIQQIKNTCKSEAEVQRRVYGRFVKDEGLKFPCFSREKNVIPAKKIDPTWSIYTGVDIGGGGKTAETKTSAHSSAITFVAVAPDFRLGYVFRGWIGRGKITTASDVLEKYRELRGSLRPVLQSYDWGARDFYVYASRLGESFTKAEKSHDIGEDIINVLFKNNMLFIFDLEELWPLMGELNNLSKDQLKRNAKDDFTDSLRYAITNIPWDWSAITDELVVDEKKKEDDLSETEKRRRFVFDDGYVLSETQRVEDEIEEYNQLYDY